jgi:hypothetical protein
VSTRVDPELHPPRPNPNAPASPEAPVLPALPILIDYDDRWGGQTLPNDHPAWMKDTLSLSQRARALVAQLRPIVIKVVAYWEHQVRSISIGNGRLSVDPSGSYRLD